MGFLLLWQGEGDPCIALRASHADVAGGRYYNVLATVDGICGGWSGSDVREASGPQFFACGFLEGSYLVVRGAGAEDETTLGDERTAEVACAGQRYTSRSQFLVFTIRDFPSETSAVQVDGG